MYASALDLAKYIVTYCQNCNNPISNLHLQKILYFMQRDTLQDTGEIIFDDPIEAWKHGPVVPNVYFFFSGYGPLPITWEFEEYDFSNYNELIDKYCHEDPWALVDETHRPGSAWSITYDGGAGLGDEITIDLIKTYG